MTNLRNALMTGKRLPYDAEVEYLESTGTQWIDTGVKGNASASLIIECTFLQRQPNGTVGFVFGSRSSANGRFGFAVVPGGNGGNYSFGYRRDHNYNVALSSTFETVRFVATPTIAECTFRGTTLTASDAPLDTNLNIYIFTRNFSGSTGQNFEGCLASLKIYQNGVLVRDYIPVRKGTVGYLYDRVSKRLFGNAGTGDFQYGQDVVPVEWLGSSGTQYIDTGVALVNGDTFSLEVDGAFTSISGVYQYMGIYASSYFGVSNTDTISVAGFSTGVGADTNRHKWVLSSTIGSSQTSTLKVDAATYTHSRTNNSGTIGLLNLVGYNYECNMKLWGSTITANSTVVRKFLPVRVGTEGAMMDELTRRIYRNAGTGAFTYSNDLKYPIPAS